MSSKKIPYMVLWMGAPVFLRFISKVLFSALKGIAVIRAMADVSRLIGFISE